MGKVEETQLSPQSQFYSSLNDEHITQGQNKHAKKVWKAFGCEILGDYHDLYLKTDACLLADVFENLTQYRLDPAPYYTSPGLSWNAVLEKTGVRLELLPDEDVHLFIEQGTRGGISMVSKLFAKANNPCVKDYDPNKPNNYILYLDANNLYCWAMGPCVNHFQRVILHGKLCCLTEKPILAKKEEAKRGLILEVDLE